MAKEIAIVTEGQIAPVTVQNTLKDVLRDPIINEDFGTNGRLSRAQAGLASAVVTRMQDRLIQQIETAHKRELSLIGGFWRLYRTPVLCRPWGDSQDAGPSPPKPPTVSKWAELFSWGNLIGGTAIVLVAVSFWYTKTTANYEQSWKHAEQDAANLRTELQSADQLNETLEDQLARAQARAEELEKALKLATANSATQTQDLIRSIQDLSTLKGQLAAQASTSKSEKKFQKLYSESEQQKENLRQENADLRKQLKQAPDLLPKKK